MWGKKYERDGRDRVEILFGHIDEAIVWLFYFVGSMMLMGVFCKRSTLSLKNVVGHTISIIGVVGIYILWPRGQHILMVILCAVFLHMLFKGSFKGKLWSYCITQCIYFIIFTFGWVSFDYIGQRLDIKVLSILSISGIWATGICIVFVKAFKDTFLYYKDKGVYESISWRQSLLYIVVSITIILAANMSVRIYREGMIFNGGNARVFIMSYTVLIMGLILCYLQTHKYATKECEVKEAELISSFSMKQLEAYKRLERLENEGKIAEEEMAQQVHKLMELVEAEKLIDVGQYIEDIQRQFVHESSYILTGNRIVDVIMNEKYKLACEKHILINVSISLLENLMVDVGDLCLMIGNSMDYALEVCEKVTMKKENKMKVQGICSRGYVIFRIWCSKARYTELEEKLSVEEETKRIIEGDLYGLGAVVKCLEKYNGKLECYTEGKWHKLEFYFNTII